MISTYLLFVISFNFLFPNKITNMVAKNIQKHWLIVDPSWDD